MNFLAQRPAWIKPVATWAGVLVGFNLVCVGATAALAFGYERAFHEKIFAGAYADNVRLDGLTREQAVSALQRAVDRALEESLAFSVGDRQIRISDATIPTEDPDVSRDLIRYDVAGTVDAAFRLGRTGGFWSNSLERLRLRFNPVSLPVEAFVDRPAAEATLRIQINDLIAEPQNAVLRVSVPAVNQKPIIDIEPERIGRAIDIDPGIDALEEQARRLEFRTIILREQKIQPDVTEQALRSLVPEIPSWLAHAPFKMSAEDRVWPVTSSTLAGWLVAATSSNGIFLTLDPRRVDATLSPLLKSVLREAADGKLVLENGKLKEFIAPVEGVGLNAVSTVSSIEEGWKNGSTTIPLVLERRTPRILGEDAERMGIREILGSGRSNFSGSPKNRRYNIALGAKKVHGSLIAPDEEFSLLKTLGTVDGKNGWLPELVIKGNKTTPEFGGGLCQIGTTVFRATLGSGLPVTERRNHSYRVRYYEPAGTDATIYEPSPDYKFKNDTGKWVLITTLNTGNDLIFTFWGTRDGREASQTKPKVYNIVSPPEKKIIETTDLKPGETKCTEVAHAGADASFDYTVTYANGEVKKTTFSSHYRPWGAVCLLGVESLSVPQSPPWKIDESGVNNPN